MWIKIDGTNNLPGVGERVLIYVRSKHEFFSAALTRRPFLFWQSGEKNFPLEAVSHFQRIEKPKRIVNENQAAKLQSA